MLLTSDQKKSRPAMVHVIVSQSDGSWSGTCAGLLFRSLHRRPPQLAECIETGASESQALPHHVKLQHDKDVRQSSPMIDDRRAQAADKRRLYRQR